MLLSETCQFVSAFKVLKICKDIAELGSCNDVSLESRAKSACSKVSKFFFKYFLI